MEREAPSLTDLVAAELAVPVDPRVTALARSIAEKHSAASRAVLFYGSCLRTAELDGQMLDFYLIVSDYRAAYDKRWLATANRLLPPNVFPAEQNELAAKYAVLSEADFHRLCGPEADNVSVWARFAQPSRMVWASDEAARADVVRSVTRAPATLFALTPDEPSADPLDRWRRGFALTYGAELRAERGERAGSIVDHDPERYRRFGEALIRHSRESGNPASPCHGEQKREIPAFAGMTGRELDAKWRSLRRRGKLLTLARLAKASLTFAGGIDYLAWKINRHAGTRIEIRPWQRRWPIIGAITLLPRLLRARAIR